MAEAPTFKLQHPEKFQVPNSRRSAGNAPLELEFLWSLDVGACSFFTTYCFNRKNWRWDIIGTVTGLAPPAESTGNVTAAKAADEQHGVQWRVSRTKKLDAAQAVAQ